MLFSPSYDSLSILNAEGHAAGRRQALTRASPTSEDNGVDSAVERDGTTSTAKTDQNQSQKRPVRDSKRRATHSQIERRRREKINDRLVTLRSIVPACTAEIEEKRRARLEEEEEDASIDASKAGSGAARGAKRRRSRRRASAAHKQEGKQEKDEELGLHKLEVLTHTIEYIYELQETITYLQHQSMESNASGTRVNSSSSGAEDAKAVVAPYESSSSHEEHRHNSQCRQAISASGEITDQEVSPVYFASKSPYSLVSNASTSNVSCLTSPMMSLSAESPLLNCTVQERPTSSKDTFTVTDSDPTRSVLDMDRRSMMALSGNEKHSRKFSDAGTSQFQGWQPLPAPLLPLTERSASALAARTTPSRYKSSSKQSHADARLLLSLKSTSIPELPMSALRKTSTADWINRPRSLSLARQSDATNAATTTIYMDRSTAQRRRGEASQSAPGGAFPIFTLPSPPLLALDRSTAYTDEEMVEE